MLAPGIIYDPATHPDTSAPTEAPMKIDAPEAPRRRHGADGTGYCAYCDTALMPRLPGQRGATKTMCREHESIRRGETQSRYAAARPSAAQAPGRALPPSAAPGTSSESTASPADGVTGKATNRPLGEPTGRAPDSSAQSAGSGWTMPDEALASLVSSIDRLTVAVGRAASNTQVFGSVETGSWQHDLMLASKELVAWRDRHLVTKSGWPASGLRRRDHA